MEGTVSVVQGGHHLRQRQQLLAAGVEVVVGEDVRVVAGAIDQGVGVVRMAEAVAGVEAVGMVRMEEVVVDQVLDFKYGVEIN